MSLVLKKGIFYHVPKTGGQWVRSFLKDNGMADFVYREENKPRGVLNLTKEHISPLHANKSVVGTRPSFAFIRNPVTWYQSFWRYKESNKGWDEPYLEYADNSFNGFMEKIMNITPGFLTRIYKEFDGVDFLGKQENLENDIVSILLATGDIDDKNIESLVYPLPTNVTAKNYLVDYDPKVLERMKKLEKWIFEKYYPEE